MLVEDGDTGAYSLPRAPSCLPLRSWVVSQCSFYEYRGYKVVYRRYASLFFIVGVEGEDEADEAGDEDDGTRRKFGRAPPPRPGGFASDALPVPFLGDGAPKKAPRLVAPAPKLPPKPPD